MNHQSIQKVSKASSNQSRASLSEKTRSHRALMEKALGWLEVDPRWYASIYFESKKGHQFQVDFKKTDLNYKATSGIVLRIYDGYSLYEQATDQVDLESVEREAKRLVARVQKASQSDRGSLKRRDYQAPSWNERLDRNLDDEILSQIPKNVNAETWVHFGIRFAQGVEDISLDQQVQILKELLGRVTDRAKTHGLDPQEISYIMARQYIGIEESLYIDREARLSQTLYRGARMMYSMLGANRKTVSSGGLGGLEILEISDEQIDEIVEDLKGLKSVQNLKPGHYRILLGPEVTGVLAHEAFGHSQEGDTCARGRSQAWELNKTKVPAGNEMATIMNNPAIFHNGPTDSAAWGSYFFDEEGWLAEDQVILDQGILQDPMTHLTSAIRLGVPRSANGKRESWASGVYTRQTNTYFTAGDSTLEELISQIDYGFLATDTAGGMEDPKGMGIQVGIGFLREVRDGKLTGRLFKGPEGGDVQLTGYTPDVLKSILGKSKVMAQDIEPDEIRYPANDVGGCGKYHKELVHAGSGGPYLLLDQVTLG